MYGAGKEPRWRDQPHYEINFSIRRNMSWAVRKVSSLDCSSEMEDRNWLPARSVFNGSTSTARVAIMLSIDLDFATIDLR